MKLFNILSILIGFCAGTQAQQPFILYLEQPQIDCISDATQIGDKFYFIQNRSFNFSPPFEFDNFCDILTTGIDGALIDEFNFGQDRTYHRILKVTNDDIFLIGSLKTDSCKSKLVISKFNIVTHSLIDLSTFDLCDNIILKIKIIIGIAGQIFIEEYHSEGPGIRKIIYKINPDYSLSPVSLDISFSFTLSVDFSRKGYLLADSQLYDFYDQDFNYRKQIHKNQDISYPNETHLPFGQNLILVETVQARSAEPDPGIQIKLIDSTLAIEKKISIFPSHAFYGNINLPFFGGIDIKNKNEIWASGHFEQPMPLDSGFYMIAKLDSNLNIICEHFLGYDTWYRTYGIRTFESGGAIVFGSRLREGYPLNEGEDIFAIRVGENCELPATVSTHGPQESLLSISAYPNPGINDLTFSVNGFDPATLTVEFIDEAGHALFRQDNLTNSIHVPELPAGQYFYRILKGEKLMGIGAWVKQ